MPKKTARPQPNRNDTASDNLHTGDTLPPTQRVEYWPTGWGEGGARSLVSGGR